MPALQPAFRTIPRVAALAAVLWLAAIPAAPAQPATASDSSPVSIGVYITNLFDISPGDESFLVNFYLWANSPADQPDPLDAVTFPRAKNFTVLTSWTRVVGDTRWSVRKYRCEHLNDWDLHAVPFDSHILSVTIRPAADRDAPLPFRIDEANSGLSSRVSLRGWRLSDFQITSAEETYRSNLGNPLPGAATSYQWVVASFRVDRHGWLLFFKLMAGAYVAFAAAMLACFMKTNQPPVFAGRVGLIIACLFSTLINARNLEGVTGVPDAFDGPDLIHMLIYVLLFVALFVTLRSRVLSERGKDADAIRFERRASLGLTLVFLAVNIAFVSLAFFAPPSDSQTRVHHSQPVLTP